MGRGRPGARTRWQDLGGRWREQVAQLHGRWHAAPLRARLVVLTTVLLLAGLSTAGAATATMLRTYVVDQVDQELLGSARTLGQLSLDRLQSGRGDDTLLPSDYYVQIQDSRGAVVEVIDPRTEDTLGRPAVSAVDLDRLEGRAGPFTVSGTEGPSRWRAVVLPVTGDGQGTVGAVTVALPLMAADRTVHRVTLVLLLSAMSVAAVGAVAAWYLVRRELRPLRAIEATAGAIAAGDLSRRVPAGPGTTEVGSLSRSLNAMLAQIEHAFAAQAASEQRMRRFVSDASHELRTPLATIRGYGELYRMGAVEDDAVPTTFGRIEDEAKRMGSLVEDLLQLARLDEGRPLDTAEVDLRHLAADAVADLRALTPDRPARVCSLSGSPSDAGGEPPSEGTGSRPCNGADGPPTEPVLVVGDENRLRQVLSNLVGNVVQHTAPGTPVEIAVGHHPTEPEWALLQVRDHGPGIAEEDAARVFERFYRVDRSRARASGGSGLGLAIVATIVAAHGGAVRVVPTPGGGTTVEIALRRGLR